MELCKTCGIIAGTHACNPIDINMKNMRLTIQKQGDEINQLAEDKKNFREALQYYADRADIYNRDNFSYYDPRTVAKNALLKGE